MFWSDPLTVFNQLSVPMLVSNFIVFLAFVFLTYFAWKYTISFYEGRPKPGSWILIILGLTIMIVSEFGQFLMPYRISPTLMEGIIVLMTQNIGVVLIAAGCFLLLKETL